MSKGGSSSGTQTTKSEPWSGAQQYLLGSPGQAATQGNAVNNQLALQLALQDNPGLTMAQFQQMQAAKGAGQGTPAVPATPGIFPEAARLYGQGGWSPEMQAALGNLQGLAGQRQEQLAQRANDPSFATDVLNQSRALMAGNYDPNVPGVANIAGGNNVTAQNVMSRDVANQIVSAMNVAAQSVDPVKARASQGVLDPTKALAGLLTGQVNNPYLDQQIAALGNDLSTNLNNNIMPGLRSQTVASGGFGGSRQGIAEGLAANGVTQQLANQAAGLRGNAFEAAQQRQYGAATGLNEQAVNNATNNANRDLQAQLANQQAQLQASLANASNNLNAQQFNSSQGLNAQQFNSNQGMNAQQFNSNLGQRTQEFNANLGLQNNAQTMASTQQQVANRAQALNFLGAGLGLQDNTFNQQFGLAQNQLGLTQQPNQYNWGNLNNYASLITPGAGLGSTATQSGTNPGNPIAGGLGGALAGSQIASALGVAGPWGAAAGGILGLLSDVRAKEDIKRVGTMDSGLPIYSYRYKGDPVHHVGVMAQEAQKLFPDAVHEGADGMLRVDYSKLG